MKYTKPATTYQEQIQILRSRGLVIGDVSRATHYLAHLSYYRLAGYWLPFEADHCTHRFRPDVNFDDVLNLYFFDRELRLLLLDAIERVEVSLRALWAYYLAHRYGPHAHLDTRHGADLKLHAAHIARLEKELARSDETFILHYKRTYRSPASPPVWAVSEIMSFGSLSRWITHMIPADRAKVANEYGLDQGMLRGFVRHLTYVRNLCAHHSRVWNRQLTVTMPLPRSKPGILIPCINQYKVRNIYNTLVVLQYLLNIVSPGNSWYEQLKTKIEEYRIDAVQMGFPNDWTAMSIWTANNNAGEQQ